MVAPSWLVLIWRLPSGLSTQRVSTWRSLRSLGAVGLTPGAAILPFQEELVEQLDWLAQGIDEHGGDAWVLPVGPLGDAEEKRIRAQMRADRAEEYRTLAHRATVWLRQAQQRQRQPTTSIGTGTDRELVALQRQFVKVRARDFFNAPERREAAQLIDRCLTLSRRAGRPSSRLKKEGSANSRALHHARASAR